MGVKPGASGQDEAEDQDQTEENIDGAEDQAAENEENPESEQDGEANPDEQGEDSKDGEGDNENADDSAEGESEDDAEGSDEVDPSETITELQNKIKELEAKMGEKKDEPEKPPTEQEIAEAEQKSALPYAGYKFVRSEMKNLATAIIAHLNNQNMENKFDTLVKDFSGSDARFKNAGNYKSGMREFMDSVRRDLWSDPKVMEKAFYYSVGKGADKTVKKIVNSRERNKQIVKVNKASSSNGKAVNRGSGKSVPAEIAELARDAGMSVPEYLMYKEKPLSEIQLK